MLLANPASPLNVVVTDTVLKPMILCFSFLPPTVPIGTLTNVSGAAPELRAGIVVGVVLEMVNDLAPFDFFFFASATLPDTRPTVTLIASARTPTSARRDRLLFIREIPPS